jgi:hypothetical protein
MAPQDGSGSILTEIRRGLIQGSVFLASHEGVSIQFSIDCLPTGKRFSLQLSSSGLKRISSTA